MDSAKLEEVAVLGPAEVAAERFAADMVEELVSDDSDDELESSSGIQGGGSK